jgi:hypothetical protein
MLDTRGETRRFNVEIGPMVSPATRAEGFQALQPLDTTTRLQLLREPEFVSRLGPVIPIIRWAGWWRMYLIPDGRLARPRTIYRASVPPAPTARRR